VERDIRKAEEVLGDDDHLDALYLKLFNELLTYMMEDARVIRRATGILFAAKHLERFGDHAMNVAEMVIYMVKGTDVRHPTAARCRCRARDGLAEEQARQRARHRAEAAPAATSSG